MKIKTTFGILCLGCIMLLFFGLLGVHADPCTTERDAYESASSAYQTAWDASQSAAEQVARATGQFAGDDTDDSNSPDPLGKLKEGLSPQTPGWLSEADKVLQLAALRHNLDEAIDALNQAEAARNTAKAALDACEAKYHKCSGCGDLIASEGITGHRSLLCSANHSGITPQEYQSSTCLKSEETLSSHWILAFAKTPPF